MVAGRLWVADNPASRLRGLLFRPPLEEGEALLIRPCAQVHTFFMRYPLDLLFIDDQWRVLAVCRNLPPWRISPWVRRAAAVVELKAGAAAGLETGERLCLREAE